MERYQTFFKDNQFVHSNPIARRNILYKLWLFTQDVLVAISVFFFGYRYISVSLGQELDIIEILIVIMTSLISISFFVFMRLYSYHQIFSKTKHISLLFEAMGLGAISVGLIGIVYQLPKVFIEIYVFPYLIGFLLIVIFIRQVYSEKLIYLIMAFGVGFVFTGVFCLIDPNNVPVIFINSSILPALFAVKAFLIIVTRLFTVQILFNKLLRKHFRRQVLIIGSNGAGRDILQHITTLNAPFWVAGFISIDDHELCSNLMNKKKLGNLDNLPELIYKHKIGEVILTEQKIDRKALIALIDFCTSKKVSIWFPPSLMPIISLKLYIDNFCGLPMIRLRAHKNLAVYYHIKYVIDVLITGCIFFLQLPLFVLIAIGIKLTSEGPVFYRAKAIGKNGEPFWMYKFRSMHINNDPKMHKEYVTRFIKGEISADEKSEKPLKIIDDPRVTSIGKLLRKYSLDELPQFINVLKGDMGLIGPRPCLPYEWEIYKDWHKKRTAIRPGVSGLWQVTGRSTVDFEDMILLDLYYIFDPSFSLDFNIMIETFFVIVGKHGAY